MTDSIQSYGKRWLVNDWNDNDIVICFESRISRNLKHNDFASIASSDDRKRVKSIISEYFSSHKRKYEDFDISDIGEIERLNIVENRMASSEFQFERPFSSVFYDKTTCNSICVNDDDHIRIKSVGRTPWEALDNGQAEEVEISNAKIKFAYQKEFGYLTSHYNECGTGIRISAILRIPSINLLKMTAPIVSIISSSNCVRIGKAFGNANKYFGDMIQLYVEPHSTAHINKSIEKLQEVVNIIVDNENKCRKMLINNDEAINSIGIAWGMATNMVSSSFENSVTAISLSSLAIKIGITRVDFHENKLNLLRDALLNIMPGHVLVIDGEKANECKNRASIIRRIFRKENEFCLI